MNDVDQLRRKLSLSGELAATSLDATERLVARRVLFGALEIVDLGHRVDHALGMAASKHEERRPGARAAADKLPGPWLMPKSVRHFVVPASEKFSVGSQWAITDDSGWDVRCAHRLLITSAAPAVLFSAGTECAPWV